jgi:hypothetical protein
MKFKTNRKGGPVIVTAGIFLILLIALTSPNVRLFDPTFLSLAFIDCLIGLDLFFGNYVLISDNTVCVVDLFFYKRWIEISDISDIFYGQQFVGRAGAKALSLRSDVHGKRASLNLGSSHFFSQQTLANIVHEIVQRNSQIQLNEPVLELINKYPRRSAPESKS